MKELEQELASVIEDYRAQAFEVVDDIMYDAYYEIYKLISANPSYAFTKSVAGIKPEILSRLQSFPSEQSFLEEISGPRKMEYQMLFLNYDLLVRKVFISRYPNAFLKWTNEEEETLKEMVRSRSSWTSISEKLHRNTNAIKIRAEKLGLATETGAKRRY